ncbi:hypothetical protein OAU50_06605 [Planctomycetota bacterium]|nr:hypothetical protein [Planctomycetota bacterium]
MPGSSNSAIPGMPGLPKAQPKAPPGGKPRSLPVRRSGSTTNPAEEAEQQVKRASTKVRPNRTTSNPPQVSDDPSPKQKSARRKVPREAQRQEPKTIDELITIVVKHAVRRDEGLTITNFDTNFMPRLKAIIPAALKRMEAEVVNEYLVDLAHSIYVAIVVGKFNSRPTLCGVRAAELAADLLERVIGAIEGREDKRVTAIRASNLLVGLTLNAVRFLESTDLKGESLDGFTERYERSVITTYGLKTQSEATGQAPWIGPSAMPLDKRIGKAINTMSSVFGNHIGEQGTELSDTAYDRVLGEFDSFTEKFAPYIEGDRMSAEERRKQLARSSATRIQQGSPTPLNITEIQPRPAGLELKTADGHSYFISHDAAREITSALLASSSQTQKITPQSAPSTNDSGTRQATDPAASSHSGSIPPVEEAKKAPEMSDDDAAALAAIEAQMQAAKKGGNSSATEKLKLPSNKSKNPVRNPFG